jgi:hypothetical protein
MALLRIGYFKSLPGGVNVLSYRVIILQRRIVCRTMLFISQSIQLLVQISHRFTCTTCFRLKGHHPVQEFLQSPFFSFHLLSPLTLASVYTLGVCWTGVLFLECPYIVSLHKDEI